MDVWDLLMNYFMFIIAGISGGLALAIALDNETISGIKPFLILFYLFCFFLVYWLFYKVREISKKKKSKK